MDLCLPLALVRAAVGLVVPVLHRLLQRDLGIDGVWGPFVRRIPGQNEGHALALVHGELADRPHVLAAVLDGGPEAEPGRTGHRDPSVVDAAHPGDRRAVVESNYELRAHLYLTAQSLDDAHDVWRTSARGHEVDQPHRAGVGLPVRLEDEGPGSVAAARLPEVGAWRDEPAAVLGCAEQGGEAGAGIEPRKTGPIDGAVASD